jgi:hypothetical protein
MKTTDYKELGKIEYARLEIEDPETCEVCNSSAPMTRERLEHIVAALQQQGLMKQVGVKDGEPTFNLTATGKNKAEAIIRSFTQERKDKP